MMSRLLLALLLGAAVSFSTGKAGEQADLEVVLRDVSQAWVARGAYPVVVNARSETGRTVRVDVDSGGFSVTRTVQLPPATAVRLEFTVPNRYFSVNYRGGEEQGSRSASSPYFDHGFFSGSYPAPLICLNSFMLRELELLPEADKPPRIMHRAVSLDDLPGRWQSYAGLISVIAMDPREASSVRADQREALARWVRWFGGRIWLAGPEAEDAARELGLNLDGLKPEEIAGGKIRVFGMGNGQIFVQRDVDALTLASNLPFQLTVNPLTPYMGQNTRRGSWLLESLMGVSTNIIVGSLLLLGLIMGPINYWFIRRKKNSLLFFATTPIIAIVGTAAVILGAFMEEGSGGYRQFAVLARNAHDGDTMLFDSRGVRSGFFADTPRFSSDTMALPFHSERSELSTDATDGLRLTSGWLIPRFATGFLLVQPVVSRMNVTVIEEGGEYQAVNDLGFAIRQVAAQLPDGRTLVAEDIPPGGRKPLRRGAFDGSVVLSGLLERVKLFADGEFAFSRVSLIAECDGLPYLEDGGMTSQLLSGEYYYVVAGDTRGIGP